MVDNYPEYLNPFAEDVKPRSKLTIRNSFRELKKSLRQSFRIKKKDEPNVTLRQPTTTTNTLFQRNTLSYPQPEALPRSRFRERASASPYGFNPFEEEEKPVHLTIKRKGKKRAPLPPKSMSNQHINDDRSEFGDSHWSLTSIDTDCSGSIYEGPREPVKRNSLVDEFKSFSKDMEALKDDTNNNVVTQEDLKHSTVPDLVVTCPNGKTFDEDSKELASSVQTHNKEDITTDTEQSTVSQEKELTKESKEIKENDETEEPKNTEVTKSEEDSEKPKKEEKMSTYDEISKSGEDDERPKEETKSVHDEVSKSEEITDSDKPKEEEKESVHDEEEEEELIVKDITDNLIEENEPYLYHEKKSLYIAGSRDELNDSDIYTGKVSLYITGSCDDLDASNNNEVCNKIASDENSNNDAVPTPKQRKNKLSKNILLGM